MTILVTRPEPGASRTVAALADMGLTVLSCPLFTIIPSEAARPTGKFAALLVTSGHGAAGLTPAVADLPANLPVFAVGDRTADAMTANGFSNVTSASGDQKALARLVLARLSPRYRVLLATGEDHKDGLAAAFADAGHEIALWIRYRAVAVTDLPAAAEAAVKAGSISKVLHYSRRASETFVALVEKAGLGPAVQPLLHVALSADVAEPLAAAGFGQVTVASQPDEAHMLTLAAGSGATAAEMVEAEAVEAEGLHAAARATADLVQPPSVVRTTPRSRKSSPVTGDDAPAAPRIRPDAPREPEVVNETAPEAAVPREVEPVGHAAAQAQTHAAAQARSFGIGMVVAVALAAGLVGAGLAGYAGPWLAGIGINLPTPPAVAQLSSRIARLEGASPATGGAEMQAAIQSSVQSASGQAMATLREQIGGLERRVGELAARPQASGAPESAAQAAALTELRGKLAEAERSAQALAPRLAEIERLSRTAAAPSASATGAAKLIVADRLARALGDGRPFATEMNALSALGAAAEPMRVLAALASAGAPSMAAIHAEFRKLRPVFAAEPASPDAPWSERLLKLTDGLVRVRSTGAVQGSSPAAVASRIDQALQRGDSAAAVAAFDALPEPARRAGEAWIVTVRQRASADQAVRTITDDAIKALSVQQ
jgi:uroporphyrinogen-III synthase